MMISRIVFYSLGIDISTIFPVYRDCIIKKNVGKACRYCGSKNYNNNGTKKNANGIRLARYICTECGKTFYIVEKKNFNEYTFHSCFEGIRKNKSVFYIVFTEYLRVEYERFLRKMAKDKMHSQNEFAKKELQKIVKKSTIASIPITVFRETDIKISKRTVERWVKRIKEDLEFVVKKYASKELDDEVWFEFLKEADKGYSLRGHSPSENKKVFDETAVWLVITAEEIRKNEVVYQS